MPFGHSPKDTFFSRPEDIHSLAQIDSRLGHGFHVLTFLAGHIPRILRPSIAGVEDVSPPTDKVGQGWGDIPRRNLRTPSPAMLGRR